MVRVIRNAFDILKQSQGDQSLPTLPERISAHTRKDELYCNNAIIDLLEQLNLTLCAKSLTYYADYLLEKNKHVKSQHALNVPSRQIEANLSMSFIPVSVSRKLETINQVLAMSSELDIIDLSSFSPTDPWQKYRYIQKLSEGLCVPAHLFSRWQCW